MLVRHSHSLYPPACVTCAIVVGTYICIYVYSYVDKDMGGTPPNNLMLYLQILRFVPRCVAAHICIVACAGVWSTLDQRLTPAKYRDNSWQFQFRQAPLDPPMAAVEHDSPIPWKRLKDTPSSMSMSASGAGTSEAMHKHNTASEHESVSCVAIWASAKLRRRSVGVSTRFCWQRIATALPSLHRWLMWARAVLSQWTRGDVLSWHADVSGSSLWRNIIVEYRLSTYICMSKPEAAH